MHTVFYNSFHFTISSHVCCFLIILIPKCSTQLQRQAQSNHVALGWPSLWRPLVRRPASLCVSLPWPPVSLHAPSIASCTRKSNRSRGVWDALFWRGGWLWLSVCNTLAAVYLCMFFWPEHDQSLCQYELWLWWYYKLYKNTSNPFLLVLTFYTIHMDCAPITNCGNKMHCAHHFILVRQFVIL